jgi:RimJ/RimL family protein N-acetyltransferase
MAAFTRGNPSDRTEFDAHYERIRNDPSCTLRAIDDDTEFVGTIGSFTMEGEREVTYWIAPARWGEGLATRALRAFLAIEPTRPIYGRVAHHNAASAKVLARAGFVEVGLKTSFAPGVGAEIVERIYRLDH